MELSPRRKLTQRYIAAADVIAKQEPVAPVGIQADANQGDGGLGAMQQLLASQARLLASKLRGSAPRHDTAVDLELVLRRLQNLASVAMAKFYAYRHDLVPQGWRHLYTDTLILKGLYSIISTTKTEGMLDDSVIDAVVESLDRALITTGGQGSTLGPSWIEGTFQLLEELQPSRSTPPEDRPNKRQRRAEQEEEESTFSSEEPYGRPVMREDRQCRRHDGWTLDGFEAYMNNPDEAPEPIVLTSLLSDWPAMGERPWNSMTYLLSKTLDGRRLVPVEVGRSYVDEGWGQELIKFGDFLHKYITLDASADHHVPVGYLAQHDLFRQIPSLRGDTRTPDLCWADVPKHPVDSSRDQARLDAPQLNAWFGPARTITPLHCDGYHNLLCQVVGTKYVRLYPPSATPNMRPRAPEHGVDMSNTSGLDLGVIEGWDKAPEGAEEREDDDDDDETEEDWKALREDLGRLEYKELVLQPGDTLLIPVGWWHYVRSLSISFSVSFWWN